MSALKFARVLVWLVYAFLVLAVIILTLAFFLLLFNASTSAPFTQWVYRSADRLLEPFRGIFPSAEGGNGSVLDFAVLFAIIMYGIFAMLVHALVYWLDGRISLLRTKRAETESSTSGVAVAAPQTYPQDPAPPAAQPYAEPAYASQVPAPSSPAPPPAQYPQPPA